jgi:hypothetical protein
VHHGCNAGLDETAMPQALKSFSSGGIVSFLYTSRKKKYVQMEVPSSSYVSLLKKRRNSTLS